MFDVDGMFVERNNWKGKELWTWSSFSAVKVVNVEVSCVILNWHSFFCLLCCSLWVKTSHDNVIKNISEHTFDRFHVKMISHFGEILVFWIYFVHLIGNFLRKFFGNLLSGVKILLNSKTYRKKLNNLPDFKWLKSSFRCQRVNLNRVGNDARLFEWK